jgi:hypothetical protein
VTTIRTTRLAPQATPARRPDPRDMPKRAVLVARPVGAAAATSAPTATVPTDDVRTDTVERAAEDRDAAHPEQDSPERRP